MAIPNHNNTPVATDDEAEYGVDRLPLPPAEARMLAYLGQLKQADRVPVMKLMADLDLIYNTNTMHLQTLARQGHVVLEKRGNVNTVRLADLAPALLIAIVPDWDDRYGVHPYSGATEQQRRRARYAV